MSYILRPKLFCCPQKQSPTAKEGKQITWPETQPPKFPTLGTLHSQLLKFKTITYTFQILGEVPKQNHLEPFSPMESIT